MMLLERGALLECLAAHLAEARTNGRLVLVVGEAGIGKSTLVDAFYRQTPASALWGACDPVVPARAFAPLVDMAAHVDGLREDLERGDRARVLNSFLNLLRNQAPGGVVVIEDLHWADEATLDLMRVVGRRLRELRVLLIGTYREEEVRTGDPLRLALGDVPADRIFQLRVPPLSVEAVEQLVGVAGVDPHELQRATGGNPFFVGEVVAAQAGAMPATVRDAVLVRVSRLQSQAQEVVRAAAVLESPCERDVLLEVARQDAAALDECIARGVLEVDASRVRFRHELAQNAVEEALTSKQRRQLHARALTALRRRGATDIARLARHAAGCADAGAVLELAPIAGDRAAELGAHRSAAQHYAAALSFAERMDELRRADLLERHARQSVLMDDLDAALASQRHALAIRRRSGDARAEGECLSALSNMLWLNGGGADPLAAAQRAVELLESAAPGGAELANAYATLAQCFLVTGSGDAPAGKHARRALGLAERCGAEAVAVDALTTLGAAEVYEAQERGWETLETALRRARSAGLDWHTGRVLVNLVEGGRDLKHYPIADRYRAEALAHVSARGAERIFLRRRLLSDVAQLDLERGRWVDAERTARAALDLYDAGAMIRVRALTVLGRLAARRGDGDPWKHLDEAASLAVNDNVPLQAARAEAAWLSGELPRGQREAEAGLERAERWLAVDPWWRGELSFWAWKTGCSIVIRPDTPEPFSLHAAGRFREAAACWRSIGCPYEEALALADSTDQRDLRSALAIFQELDAQPMATAVARTLREAGARAVPRGPRASTARNPARLTRRELEVLDLIGVGLRNAEIAERLVVSPKTVENHVSAIMKKLRVDSRAAAAEKAASLRIQR